MSPAVPQPVPIGPRRAARQLRDRVAAIEALVLPAAGSTADRTPAAMRLVIAAWGSREREVWGPLAARAALGEAVAALAPPPRNEDGIEDADREPAELVVRLRHLRALALAPVDALLGGTPPPPPALAGLVAAWCADDSVWWALLVAGLGDVTGL